MRVLKFIKKRWMAIIIASIFLIELFLRFYQIDIKNPFGYDQVDNAWAAKNIIVNHWYPLIGMVAKADSGIYIGPVYYYIVAIFYWLTNLNPIASPILAGVTSIFTFVSLYVITKKLFNREVALIALIINTFNFDAIIFDKIQWPVALIPSISLVIFFLLFKVITGDVKKIPWLALVVGFAFNIHFTAVFFPIIILLSLPFFPRTKQTIKYVVLSLPLFLVWIIPNIIYQVTQKSANMAASSYLTTNFHGFHLRRVVQIIGDALIQFNPYLTLEVLKPFKIIILPLFLTVFYIKSLDKNKLKFIYLVILWFIVPWLVFATYSGEISDYYFSINRFIALGILSYFIYLLWSFKLYTKVIVIILLLVYCVYNLSVFLPYKDVGLSDRSKTVQKAINEGRRVEFGQGVPESYFYWYYMWQKGKNVY
jgi:4-amino-4-deoxy-L-arabinose transferase-like glycosyltransferase